MIGKVENYLHDVLEELKVSALEAKGRRDASIGTDDYDYELGRLFAFYEVISLFKSQAEAFDIVLHELSGINPDRDLL